MTQVLQNWEQVGQALLAVQRRGLPADRSAPRNWDHWLLLQCLENFATAARILELGCGTGFTLRLLASAGYTNLDGIDSILNWRLRVGRWLWRWRNRTARSPYRVHTGDFTQTRFPNDAFDFAFSVSVIEHGVRLAPFLEECFRVLKPGGLLFLTADYWEPKIQTNSSNNAFGRAWNIFCRDEIERLFFIADKIGYHLVNKTPIPACAQPLIRWQDKEYTAIALLLRKPKS